MAAPASAMTPSKLGLRGLRLYAGILRAHRALPPQMRSLGDAYVREEFRKHRAAKDSFLAPFFREWDGYLAQLQAGPAAVGRDLGPDQAAALTQEQREQLARLHEEATKLAR